MKKQKIFINGTIRETELNVPNLKTVEEKMARIKPYFSCMNVVKSSLEDTKFTTDIMFDGKVVMRALLSVTNGGGSLGKRKVSIPAGGIDFQKLKEDYRTSKIPFIVINEDRGYIEESGIENATSRWFPIDYLEEAKLTNKILKNDADNLVVVPLEQLEEYIFDNVIFQLNEQYA